MSLKIAHITDIHIPPDDQPVRDIDVKRNFSRILRSVVEHAPDLIVFGGDLAAVEGEVACYEWIKAQLQSIQIPFSIIPGNHDRLDNLSKVFPLDHSEHPQGCFRYQLDALYLVGLDSSQGSVSEEQLFWLRQSTATIKDQILLFLHHPPLDCNCLFMDRNYPLKNRETVFETLLSLPDVNHVFCGHYHTEKTVIKDGKTIFITPSTMLQISQDTPSYQLDHTQPGWRLIEWLNNTLLTRVVYLEP